MLSSMEVDEIDCNRENSLSSETGLDPEVSKYCDSMVRVATECEKMFVEMYRSCYPNLFTSLVKLQLSFLVELPLEFMLSNTDDQSSTDDETPCTSSNRPSSPLRRVFRLGTRQEIDATAMQPISSQLIVGFRCLFAYLYKGNRLATPFLFRVPGCASRVEEIRELILRNDTDSVDMDKLMSILENCGYSTHDVASALKQCFSALSTNNTLFNSQLQSLFLQVAALATPKPDEAGVSYPLKAGDTHLFACKQLKALRLLLLLLPNVNCHLILKLLDLLKTVSRLKETHMNAKALGIIFGPVFFPPVDSAFKEGAIKRCNEQNSMVSFMIEQYPGVQEIPASIVTAISTILDAHNSMEDAPSTVTYVTRRKTGKEVARAYTEYAISELYAHVAKWPESTRKRRIVRKISKMNGGITPSQIAEMECSIRQSKNSQPKRSDSMRSRLRPRIEKRHKRSITDREDVKLFRNK